MYAIFDLLYLDGHSLMELPYSERRARARAARASAGRAWRVPAAHAGRGRAAARGDREQGLEGVVAKRLDSRYEPGRRSRRVAEDQEHAPPGARDRRLAPGRGAAHGPDRRAADGLLRGRRASYAGRVGTGFTETTLDDLAQTPRAAAPRRDPFDAGAASLPREAVFVEPRLVAEVEFREWTAERRDAGAVVQGAARGQVAARGRARGRAADAARPERSSPDAPEALFDEVERLPEGALIGRTSRAAG